MSSTERQVRRYDSYLSKILPGFCDYNPRDKQINRDTLVRYMLDRTQRIFEWKNLPDTIPARMLELYLQVNGNCAFYKYPVDNQLYVYVGGFGGEPDEYYRPTIYTIANPAQNLDINAKINIDCVVMPNDSMYMGLLPLHSRYAYSMVETELSMHMANINSRIVSLISAQDDATKSAGDKYIQDIEEGKLSIIAESKFFEDLKTSPFAGTGAHAIITDLIELMQYNKASWYNEIGLNANYNMKRESINSNESQLNNDALAPLVDDMKHCRETYATKVNEMFGTDISVDFASSWRDNEREIEEEIKAINDEGGEENEAPEII